MKKTTPAAKKSRRHEAARPNQTATAQKPKAPAKPKAKAGKAKTATKAAAKPVTKKPAPKKATKAVEKKAAAKSAKATKAVAKKPAKPVKPAKVVKAAKAVKPAKVEPKKAVAAKAVKAEKSAKPVKEAASAKATAKVKGEGKSKEAAKSAAPTDGFPALEGNVKRPAKPFFLEVKPGVERVIKRGDKSAVSQVIDLQARRKGPATEETSDELAERIERELQSQSFLKRAPMRPQMCTKCGINAVTPRFTIDRELGYCEICAEILHLGETKEAKRMELNLAVKKDEEEEGAAGDSDEEPVPEDIDD